MVINFIVIFLKILLLKSQMNADEHKEAAINKEF